MTPLCINGRFLTRPMTGVDRVAAEMTRAILEICAATGREVELIAPAHTPETPLGDMRIRRHGAIGGHPWEQMVLPRIAGRRFVLNFCNSGPLFRRRQVVFIHDAQTVTHPESYGRIFRLAYGAMLPRLARNSAVSVTVSEFAKNELERTGLVPRDVLRVIPNGADHILRTEPDPDALQDLGLETGRYVLAIGSAHPHKNIGVLKEAARRAEAPLQIVITGHGQDGRGFRHLGRVSDAALRALYAGARALALPSRTEGFGLPVVEAMACGCPVIVARAGALPEICGDAALLVAPDDPDAWMTAMNRIVHDDTLHGTLSDAGRRRSRIFVWRRSAERLLSLVDAAAEVDDAP